MPEKTYLGSPLRSWIFLGVLLGTIAWYKTFTTVKFEMESYGAFRYEIHGKVQGVYFRKHTAATAKELGLVGWVMNTAQGTVVGEAQGKLSELAKLRSWLKTTGSPKSKIQKAVFTEERADLVEGDLTFTTFDIRK